MIAPGFQTFGQDYEVIAQASMNIDIRLKRPTSQFTIYEKGGTPATTNKEDGSPQQGTPVENPHQQ